MDLPVPKDGQTFGDVVDEIALKVLCNCPNKGTGIEINHHYANCEYVAWYEQTQKESVK